MNKLKDMEMMNKDKEMMKHLVGYITGKPFPLKHTVMDVDDVYGIKMLNPCQIFESTEPEPGKENTRFLITYRDLKKARIFVSEAGVWKSQPKNIIKLFDASNRRIGCVKISWYHRYFNTEGTRKSRRSQWNMREYHVASNYLPLNKVDRKYVLLTVLINTNIEQKSNIDIQSLSNKLGRTLDLSQPQSLSNKLGTLDLSQPQEDSSMLSSD